MQRDVQDRLMNWGYAICDAALRTHVDVDLQAKLKIEIRPSNQFPFAGGYWPEREGSETQTEDSWSDNPNRLLQGRPSRQCKRNAEGRGGSDTARLRRYVLHSDPCLR